MNLHNNWNAKVDFIVNGILHSIFIPSHTNTTHFKQSRLLLLIDHIPDTVATSLIDGCVIQVTDTK